MSPTAKARKHDILIVWTLLSVFQYVKRQKRLTSYECDYYYHSLLLAFHKVNRSVMRFCSSLVLFVVLLGSLNGHTQGRGGGPPPAARAPAPFDMTGYWVSIVSEDWRWRMFPNKGDYAGVPLNAEGRRMADTWDPAKDVAAGEQCKAYGAPGIMRIPGRFHITWQDDQTLKIETDAGKQIRLFRFDAAPAAGADIQGVSKAEWELAQPARGFAIAGDRPGSQAGSLKVTTTNVRPGYLRRNGVPYSANAKLTEYYDLVKEANGTTYLVLTSTLEDPTYLTQPMITAAHFRKQADATGWNRTSCCAR